MNKNPFVRFAWLALGFVLLFGQSGCADDNNHVANTDNESWGSSHSNSLDFGLAQAQSGQPFSFNNR